jgi:hypothetical protein
MSYVWRLCGCDFLQHAFKSDDGHLPRRAMVTSMEYETPTALVTESFGPYDAFVSECGHVMPVAMDLPADNGPTCTLCVKLVGLRIVHTRPHPGRSHPMNELPLM